jgi:hypothetical protein
VDGSRVVALGEQTIGNAAITLAELSVDGGAAFMPVPFGAPGPDPAITALTADAGGFTAAVQSGQARQQGVTVWMSASGASWTESHLSGLTGSGTHQLTALDSSGTTVTAIGSIATPQRQQSVVLTFSDR